MTNTIEMNAWKKQLIRAQSIHMLCQNKYRQRTNEQKKTTMC